MTRTATFDPERIYRYRLSRTWDPTLPPVTWIMLNPSTADESVDDRTISRVIGFSRRWGHGSAVVVNLFAFRTTSPRGLTLTDDPVGPSNDEHLAETLTRSPTTLVAWGNHGGLANPTTGMPRSEEMWRLLDDLETEVLGLGFTAGGQPAHPLYLPGNTRPTPAAPSVSPPDETSI